MLRVRAGVLASALILAPLVALAADLVVRRGGPGNDRLRGSDEADTVLGGPGDDLLQGLAGPDRLFGQQGEDRISAGPGQDLVVGGPGRDQLNGGPGRDILDGGRGADRVTGGLGPDIFRVGHLDDLDRLHFDQASGDQMDLGPLLGRFGPDDRIESFIEFRPSPAGTIVAVDRGGSGGPFVDAALLVDTELSMPQLVTPNPIPEAIAPGPIAVELVDVAGVAPSTAPLPSIGNGLNFLSHADDGSGRIFVVDSRGEILLLRNGEIRPTPFLDLVAVRGDALLAEGGADGLRTFAFHPDFNRRGAPGFGKLYTASVETVESADPGTPVLRSGFDFVRHHDVLAEWTIDPARPNRVDPESRREILRIEQPEMNHNIDLIAFDLNAELGSPDHGLLYLAIGDGGNFTPADSNRSGQDPNSPLGKILRIDPLQDGALSYTVPTDNPFIDDPAFLPEIWAVGFRHPQRFSWDPGGDHKMLIADIGEQNVEEVNLGVGGGNYGWREREGTFAVDHDDSSQLFQLPAFDASFDYIYPVAQYDHDEGIAITGGFVYRGTQIPELVGQYVFGDIVNGRIFHVAVADLELGRQAPVQELTLLREGAPITLLDLVDAPRADLRFGQDEAGEIYVTTKQDGMIRTFAPADGSEA